MTFAKTSVEVKYKGVDGWHIFESDELVGLLVASKDPAIAFADVPTAIEQLLMLDEGIKCKAMPEMTLDEFLGSLRGTEVEPHQLVMEDKRYIISPEAMPA